MWYCWNVVLLKCGTVEMWYCWNVVLLKCGTVEIWYCWNVVLLKCGTVEMWYCWNMVLLKCGTVETEVRKYYCLHNSVIGFCCCCCCIAFAAELIRYWYNRDIMPLDYSDWYAVSRFHFSTLNNKIITKNTTVIQFWRVPALWDHAPCDVATVAICCVSIRKTM